MNLSLSWETLHLGIDVNGKRRGMNKWREGGNDYRRRISPIIDVQTLDTFIRELWVSMCLSPLLHTPFIYRPKVA